MIRPTLLLLLSAFTLSCGGKPTPPQTPDTTPPTNATGGQVDLSIASITLAEDCGTPPSSPPLSSAREAAPMGDVDQSFASVAYERRGCEQSSVQLRVANGTEAPSTITIRKVELLDERGAVLRELTPRDASQWSSDTYQPWDQQVAANQTLQVSYALSDPSVSPGGTYTVRLVVATAAGERTIEQRTTLQAEASLPPGAVT